MLPTCSCGAIKSHQKTIANLTKCVWIWKKKKKAIKQSVLADISPGVLREANQGKLYQ